MRNILLNSLTDGQYLLYFLKKTKTVFDDYTIFCTGHQANELADFIESMWENKSIDILPYLYTVADISSLEFDKFLRFVKYYFEHAEIPSSTLVTYMNDNKCNCNRLASILQEDDISMVALLCIMQYYFI